MVSMFLFIQQWCNGSCKNMKRLFKCCHFLICIANKWDVLYIKKKVVICFDYAWIHKKATCYIVQGNGNTLENVIKKWIKTVNTEFILLRDQILKKIVIISFTESSRHSRLFHFFSAFFYLLFSSYLLEIYFH
jgi:hypothetical protein